VPEGASPPVRSLPGIARPVAALGLGAVPEAVALSKTERRWFGRRLEWGGGG
jgi:hypothetical protein